MFWRYENYGTADLLKNPGAAVTVPSAYTKFGFGIKSSGSSAWLYFNVPTDSMEIWAKFDVHFTSDYSDGNRIAFEHRDSDGKSCGFYNNQTSISENAYLFVNENTSSRQMPDTNFSRHSDHTFLVHLLSAPAGKIGIVEVYVDAVRSSQSYVGDNVNNGNCFDNIFISAADSMIVSNIIISNCKIGLAENVSMNNLGLKYIVPEFADKYLIAGYDVKAISESAIKYNAAVKSLIDVLLNRLDNYEKENSYTIKYLNSNVPELEKKYLKSPNLTEEENRLLEERQNVLCKTLIIDIGELKNKILNVKFQIEQDEKFIDDINCHKNSLAELATFQNKNRPHFSFLADNLLQMIMQSINKVDLYNKNIKLIQSIMANWKNWTDSYKTFKTTLYSELKNICDDIGIDEEIYKAWYADWQKKRFAIEQRFLPLVSFALKGNLLSKDDSSSPAERILDILKTYKEQVDNFYLNERKNIYQKFAFQAGGDLQEKFETESALYKFTVALQMNLYEIIFLLEKTEERLFLLDWIKPLLNLPIDEIINFVKEKELSSICAEVIEQFSELKNRNFATYIADSQAYAETIKRCESDYNSIMFRMRKDLHKK